MSGKSGNTDPPGDLQSFGMTAKTLINPPLETGPGPFAASLGGVYYVVVSHGVQAGGRMATGCRQDAISRDCRPLAAAWPDRPAGEIAGHCRVWPPDTDAVVDLSCVGTHELLPWVNVELIV